MIGAVTPESAKPPPVIAIELIVTGEVPDDVSVIDCSAGELIRTLPNGMLDAFAISSVLTGPNCTLKLFAIPFAVAVRVAVWVVLTAFTFAVNDALIAPEGTVTKAGTVTEELLLASETVNPVSGAAP